MSKSVVVKIVLFIMAFKAVAYDREAIRLATDLSPVYVGEHNKAGWQSLFVEEGAMIEDPVGGPVYKNLSSFWDTFIAPNQIVFEPVQDLYGVNFRVRKVVIHVSSAGGKVNLVVPAHIVYEMVEEKGQLKIKKMRVFWDEGSNFSHILNQGLSGIGLSLEMGFRMMVNLGLCDTLDYALNGINPKQGRWSAITNSFVNAVGDATVGADRLEAYLASDVKIMLSTSESSSYVEELWSNTQLRTLLRGVKAPYTLSAPIVSGHYGTLLVENGEGQPVFFQLGLGGGDHIHTLWVAVDTFN